MSFASDCPACGLGNHDQHDPDHGIVEGLIGGTHCPCSGDCAERFAARGTALADKWFPQGHRGQVATPPAPTTSEPQNCVVLVCSAAVAPTDVNCPSGHLQTGRSLVPILVHGDEPGCEEWWVADRDTGARLVGSDDLPHLKTFDKIRDLLLSAPWSGTNSRTARRLKRAVLALLPPRHHTDRFATDAWEERS